MLNVLNNADDAWVEIAVTDSGVGVEPKYRSRLFEPFFTTKPLTKGTGLGLSVSQNIMHSHKGQIFLDTDSERTRSRARDGPRFRKTKRLSAGRSVKPL
jgi:signal transduction histidine kinase